MRGLFLFAPKEVEMPKKPKGQSRKAKNPKVKKGKK